MKAEFEAFEKRFTRFVVTCYLLVQATTVIVVGTWIIMLFVVLS